MNEISVFPCAQNGYLVTECQTECFVVVQSHIISYAFLLVSQRQFSDAKTFLLVLL